DLRRAIKASGGQLLSVRAPSDARYILGVAAQCQQFLPAGHVPDLRRAIKASGGQLLSVTAPSDAGYIRGVAAQCHQVLRPGHVPDLRRPVFAPRGDLLAVPERPGDARDRTVVTLHPYP